MLQGLRERGKLSEKVRHVNFYEHMAKHPLKPQAKLAAAKFAPEHTDFRVESSISYLDSDATVFSESSWAGPERSADRKTYFRRDGSAFLTDTKFRSQDVERRLLEVLDAAGRVTARFTSAGRCIATGSRRWWTTTRRWWWSTASSRPSS
ncbi:hypothetical protein [Glutamicibacter soli]|uniref:hypothetical protein n=1 Tax=Glutamicibacter soli TaxID=453836 RepID=UPI0011BE05C0|nr:hypothetical protein [Glutamicibacter soli]